MLATHQTGCSETCGSPLAALAAIVGLILSSPLAKADNRDSLGRPPGPLPAAAIELAKPMATTNSACAAAKQTAPHELWQILSDHDAGRITEAIEGWKRAKLPGESQVWRFLGLGVAHLHLGELDEATIQLITAWDVEPDNPLVHYLLGVLGVLRSQVAADWPDAMRMNLMTRTVSHTANAMRGGYDTPKSQSRYELEAIVELERAVALASALEYDAPLVPTQALLRVPCSLGDEVMPPSIRDLLAAVWADNFEGTAHGLLAHLYLDHGRSELAEHHVDEALRLGFPVPYGYRRVGQQYDEQGRCTDALRAYSKALKHGDALAKPGANAVENMRKALHDLL